MIKVIFIGDQRKGVTKYRGYDPGTEEDVNCDLDNPASCEKYVSAKKAVQLLNDHPTWFKMPGKEDVDVELEKQIKEEKAQSKIIPLEEALALQRAKKISYMKRALGLKITDKMKVSELDMILESYYEDEEIEV